MRRTLRRAAAATASVVCLVVTLMGVPTVAAAAPSAYSVLQINLCNSGLADCYTGRATDAAGELIAARLPSVVTVNEMCSTDIDAIKLRTGYNDFETFTQSGTQFCKDGKGLYGNAMLFPPGTSVSGYRSFRYAAQNHDKEKRTLSCAVADGVAVCVTHLSRNRDDGKLRADDLKIRASQADEMSRYIGTQLGAGPRILGGDWNMKHGGNPDAQEFVPAGMFRKGDGNVQHVLASSAHFRFERVREMDLSWTDHPGFQVYYTRG